MIMDRTNDVNIKMRMSEIMFRVYSRYGEFKKAYSYFKLYRNILKKITNQLEKYEPISSIIKKGNYAQILKEAKIIQRKKN
jgi:hypothetical protein